VPGAYSHLTLVNLAKEPLALERAAVPAEVISALLDYSKYCELGAVSPDYPYLAMTHPGQKQWADYMHYTRVRSVISAGIAAVRHLQGEVQRKCVAWLMGYAAHVTTDMTIHPVVEAKVGTYQGHERQPSLPT
jgi:hypothetical protein